MVTKTTIFNFLFALVFGTFISSCSSDGDKEVPDDDSSTVEDITPPSIDLQGLLNDQVLSEKVQITVNLSDDNTQNINLKILLDGEEIYDSSSEYSLEFDPDLYTVGEKMLRFVATDDANNSDVVEINVKIQRILLRLFIEENYIRNPIEQAYAFLSDVQGNPLDSLEISNQQSHLFLAPLSFDAQKDFVLTVVTKERNDLVNIESTPGLNREKLSEFYLKNKGRFDFETIDINYASTGFPHLEGLGYTYLVFTPNQNEGTLDLLDRENPTDYIYILSPGGPVNGTHFVAKLKRDTISNPLILDIDDFNSDNISVGNFPYADNSDINLIGFENLDDFQNYRFHNALFGIGQIISPDKILHPYIDNFAFYRHSYTDLYGSNLDGYRYLGEGLPLNEYNPIETDLSTVVENGTIQITYSPINDYFSGKVHLKSENQKSNWVITFNPSMDKELILPKMPVIGGLESLDLLDYAIKSSRISRYSDVGSYDEYLLKVKSKAFNYYSHSSFTEHITIWPSQDNREQYLDPLR
ncbi:hypothetical protein [Allomuricauda sp. R78024]|uniref:hypothetical protein n=1 Tax=Allomuricauda sp. R78024 TaxID=3093867 RepID=UPI0037CB25A8